MHQVRLQQTLPPASSAAKAACRAVSCRDSYSVLSFKPNHQMSCLAESVQSRHA